MTAYTAMAVKAVKALCTARAPIQGQVPGIQMPGDNDFIRSAEAARIARVSTDTVSRWCRDGKVNGYRDGSKRWMVNKDSLEQYLRSSGDDQGTGSKKTQ